MLHAQRVVSKSTYRTKSQTCGLPAGRPAARPAPPPPTWKTSILSHFLIPEKGGLFFWNNLALKCSNFCHFSKAYFLALFRLKMVHFLSFFIKLFFRTHFYFVFDRIRACSCQKRVCFHVGRFIRNFLCVFVVLCVNLLCVTVGGGRRSARVFRGVTTFPPLLTLPYHTPDYLQHLQAQLPILHTGKKVTRIRPSGRPAGRPHKNPV